MTDRRGWFLDPEVGPIFQQIGDNVRRFLARGDLRPGEKLPSARDLAGELRVNPNTVVHAYSELEGQGVLETRRGLGSFVREDAPVEGMRQDLIRRAASRFAEEAVRLGLSKGEAIAAVKEVLDARTAR